MSNYYHKGSKVLIKGLGVEPQLENFRHMVATKSVSADTTLSGEDSGKVIFCSGASAVDITLPSPVAGYNFKFIVTDVTNDVDIVQAGSSDDFVGTIVNGAGGSDSATASDTKIVFDQSGGVVVGDWVFLVCDGTNWYVQGNCDASGGVVFG
jgi:hypothetical protein